MSQPVVKIDRLTHRYGERTALDALSLDVRQGELFSLLGPNGSGKTTLFRILSTLIPAPEGTVSILGQDLAKSVDHARRALGVLFQSPSLDKQLTARENLVHQGHLYGMQKDALNARIEHLLSRVNLLDRQHEYVAKFSGGMRRRVELAKAMLHSPKILLLDEPSTGLDPGSRIDLWRLLEEINHRDGVTILLTTHLMDEADRCDRLAVLSSGILVACDTPAALKSRVGGDVITLASTKPDELAERLHTVLGVECARIGDLLRIERQEGHAFVPQLVESAPGLVDSISVGKPTLEDVFIHLTGRNFANDSAVQTAAAVGMTAGSAVGSAERATIRSS